MKIIGSAMLAAGLLGLASCSSHGSAANDMAVTTTSDGNAGLDQGIADNGALENNGNDSAPALNDSGAADASNSQ